MDYIKENITEKTIKSILAIVVLVLIMIALSKFENLILLTTIFVFIVGKIRNAIYNKVGKKIKLSKKLITVLIFLIFIGLLLVSLAVYVPKLTTELIQLKANIQDILQSSDNVVVKGYAEQLKSINYMEYIKDNYEGALKTINVVQEGTVTFILSLILSLFILLDEKGIHQIGEKLERSKVKFFYAYYKELGRKFLNSFGAVIQVQLTVAVINSILSVIGLTVLGFPEPFALGFMIFFLSLIPVLGVVISLIPLLLIAFKIGGIQKIFMVVALICILHALEAYVINPKLMSDKSHLPIFLTFAALIVGERVLGVWGLIIGVPILMFVMEVLEIK